MRCGATLEQACGQTAQQPSAPSAPSM
jgi:hypothetical protein